MPAKPAWPPKSLSRLFVEEPLRIDSDILITGPQAHYLRNVMRMAEGESIMLCDDLTGEYRATITSIGKRQLIARVEEKYRDREAVPDLWLCAAPIKKDRWYWLVEKACELGVKRIQPVRTERTIIDRIKPEKLRTHVIEAAEQCERTALPELSEMASLQQLLDNWPNERHLFFADERLHQGEHQSGFTEQLHNHAGPAGLLIGPEGGFSDAENAAINAHPRAIAISLGPRILRAETAALTATAIWMANHGDWVE